MDLVDQVFEVRRNRRHWCGEIELPLPQRIIHTELLGLQDPDNSVDSDALFSYLREQVVPLLLNAGHWIPYSSGTLFAPHLPDKRRIDTSPDGVSQKDINNLSMAT